MSVTADKQNSKFSIPIELHKENPENKGFLTFSRRLTLNEIYERIETTLSLITIKDSDGENRSAKGSYEWHIKNNLELDFKSPAHDGELAVMPREGYNEGNIIDISIIKDNTITQISSIKYLTGSEETWMIAHQLSQAIVNGYVVTE